MSSKMKFTSRLVGRRLLAAPSVALLLAGAPVAADTTLLNVSYDPTRELYSDFNRTFARH
jgi:sulfate transport system substrate-binding protein